MKKYILLLLLLPNIAFAQVSGGAANWGNISGTLSDQTDLQSALDAGGGGGGATFALSGATVFSGTSPTSWTDLDLSGTVGANAAMVLLSIDASSDMNAVAVRQNGDTDEYYDASNDASAYGMALGHHDSANAAIVLMAATDASGVIEWKSETASTATIKIIAYIK